MHIYIYIYTYVDINICIFMYYACIYIINMGLMDYVCIHYDYIMHKMFMI